MATVSRSIERAVTSKQMRTIPLGLLASRLLLTAFTISVAYQVYPAMLMEVPEYDGFPFSTAVVYGIFFILSFLAGARKCWAPWLTLAMSICFTLIAIVYYFPVLTPVRSFGLIDWTEGVLYSGLILAAGILSICDLFGLTLTAE